MGVGGDGGLNQIYPRKTSPSSSDAASKETNANRTCQIKRVIQIVPFKTIKK